ncbi:Fe(2+)-trafficking protein [Humisphaera borealis]|uniref:Fe(2+)-trafficking protein n=1 Tax=Humisphaera borealis TaxID=2807512 RepID=A0A7M2WY63_9BACT|nr:Fe(2+)-trafficking protein [Humisphaera borealis]QOV90415.1 Fe(2+)-trafficking protein [Humisphaera borealis]
MTDNQTRIDQFRKMANDDPGNELGHFSLGKALLEAGQHAEAIASLERVLAIKPDFSKAYSLHAQALIGLGKKEDATALLTKGVVVAHNRGDKMPRDEMVALLKELGAPVPELKESAVQQAVGEGEVICRRCGKPGPKLAKPPFRNAFGQQVFEGICAPCWEEAKKMGVKVINELRLPLNDPNANKLWEQHIREFLNLQV